MIFSRKQTAIIRAPPNEGYRSFAHPTPPLPGPPINAQPATAQHVAGPRFEGLGFRVWSLGFGVRPAPSPIGPAASPNPKFDLDTTPPGGADNLPEPHSPLPGPTPVQAHPPPSGSAEKRRQKSASSHTKRKTSETLKVVISMLVSGKRQICTEWM